MTMITNETVVLIAGSRDASPAMLAFTRRAVRKAHHKGYTIVVGDNPRGVDRAVMQECNCLKAKVLVVGIANCPRNGGCYHGRYLKIDPMTYSGMGGQRLNAYTVRDRYMVDQAQIAVFIWNGDSPGTKAGYDYVRREKRFA
jgi:hypothetical protein